MLLKLEVKLEDFVDCRFVYSEWQPGFHIFLYFSYTGVGALEGPYQVLLCLLESGKAIRGTSCRGGGSPGQGEEPDHPL